MKWQRQLILLLQRSIVLIAEPIATDGSCGQAASYHLTTTHSGGAGPVKRQIYIEAELGGLITDYRQADVAAAPRAFDEPPPPPHSSEIAQR